MAQQVADAGLQGLYAHVGRRTQGEALPPPARIGSFGGAEGLARYATQVGVTHFIDASHPFSRKISENVRLAAEQTGLPLLTLSRPAWAATPDDAWRLVPDMRHAVKALGSEPQRVFLALPQRDVARFRAQPQHFYLLRLTRAPRSAPPLPNHQIVVSRGPYDAADEEAFLKEHRIGLIVTRNTGAAGARGKLDAARALNLPVVMVERPPLPDCTTVTQVNDALGWLAETPPGLRQS